MAGTLRVYEMARELGTDPRRVISALESLGVAGVSNHMSVVEAELVPRVRDALVRLGFSQPTLGSRVADAPRPERTDRTSSVTPPARAASTGVSSSPAPELDAEALIRAAFETHRAKRKSKPGWSRMLVAVFKNRLLDLSGQRFDEASYGVRHIRDFVALYPSLVHLIEDSVQLLGTDDVVPSSPPAPSAPPSPPSPSAPSAPSVTSATPVPEREPAPSPPSPLLAERFRAELGVALAITDVVARVQYLNSVIRAIMQCAAVAAAEYWIEFGAPIHDPEALGVIERLRQPTDGIPREVLNQVLASMDANVWPGCAPRWFEKAAGSDGSGRCAALTRQAEAWVKYRNARPAHGVQDRASSEEALSTIVPFAEELVNGLASLLPRIDAAGRLVVDGPQGELCLQAYPLVDGKPVVILDIRQRAVGWLTRCQVLDAEKSREAACPLEPPLRLQATERQVGQFQGRVVELSGGRWHPTVLLPERQTTTFEGRGGEIVALREWFDDLDSRACLIWGEGGIGKTTLVLEFLHRVLAGELPDVLWRPDIICFFTAKMTRWTATGLKHIRGTAPAVVEAVRRVAHAVQERHPPEWYTAEPLEVINKVEGLLQRVSVRRENVLLVIDNTETLVRATSDEKELNLILSRIAARVGRVIMTSRRHEAVEARSIRVEPLPEEDGAMLLQRLATAYHAKPLASAGDAGRRRFSRRMSGRPLLLEIFARRAAIPGISLETALEHVLQSAGADLGLFLFEDAWRRMPEPVRSVFLALSQFQDGIDNQVVGRTCSALGIAHDDWTSAFEETRFGSIISHGSSYEVALSQDVLRYLGTKYDALPAAERTRLREVSKRVEVAVRALHEAAEAAVPDRSHEAYRSDAAKAARLAAARYQHEEALRWYEEAVTLDEHNAALWDRYAWYLLIVLGHVERAKECAARAVELAPKDADATFTAGMVAARLGEIAEADAFLQRAEESGKPRHLCLVQRARARVVGIEALPINQRGKHRAETRRLLQLARNTPESGPMAVKHLRECTNLGLRLERSTQADGRAVDVRSTDKR